jgi:hypothetical protein
MEFTFNNHLKYFINNELYGIRKNPFDKYRVEVGKVDEDHYAKSSLYLELTRIADLVSHQLGKDFEVYFSGGTDCEIVIKSFLAIGIKPKLLTIRYSDDSNLYEVIQAQRTAFNLGLKVEIVDFDVREFYLSGAATDMSQKIYCSQLLFDVLFEVVRRRQRPAIMGGNVPLTKKIGKFDPYWYYTYVESEESCSVRFNKYFNIPTVYEFFSYTPEAMLYWLESDGVKKLVNDTNNFKLKAESSKNQILIDELPEFNIELRMKTHGWEKTVAFNHEATRHVSAQLTPRFTDCLDGIKYTEIIKQLKGIT